MNNYNWNYPTTLWVGNHRIKDLSLACANLNVQNPLFVTDKDLVNLQMVKEIISENKKNLKISQFFQIFQEIQLVKMLMMA